jgi:hypothetical protein
LRISKPAPNPRKSVIYRLFRSTYIPKTHFCVSSTCCYSVTDEPHPCSSKFSELSLAKKKFNNEIIFPLRSLLLTVPGSRKLALGIVHRTPSKTEIEYIALTSTYRSSRNPHFYKTSTDLHFTTKPGSDKEINGSPTLSLMLWCSRSEPGFSRRVTHFPCVQNAHLTFSLIPGRNLRWHAQILLWNNERR